jgi:hypothetical protein
LEKKFRFVPPCGLCDFATLRLFFTATCSPQFYFIKKAVNNSMIENAGSIDLQGDFQLSTCCSPRIFGG